MRLAVGELGAILAAMSTRTVAAFALCSAFACAKATPQVSEQRLQPVAAASAQTASPQAPSSAAADPHAGFQKLSVDEVAALIDARKVQPVDANGADTRKEYGTLPGAVLLTSFRTFDLSELPADKSQELVFYCGGEACSAAPQAAARAKEAGYTAVRVMSAGIIGWVKAHKPVAKLDV
jgi:rhodanese-related sulfurtransferase